MSLEGHGGVADQMTNLALELPAHDVRPLILVRNPMEPEHQYVTLLRENGVAVWSIANTQQERVRSLMRWLHFVLLPIILIDAILRRKSLAASRHSMWGVLRRFGYLGLDAIFWLRLIQARIVCKATVAHFRNPDGYYFIPWAKRLGMSTVYTEDTIPQPSASHHYYELLKQHSNNIDQVTAVSEASRTALMPFLRNLGTEVVVIPNMVQCSAFGFPRTIASKHENVILGCIARLVPEKDVTTVLHAMAFARARDARLHLVIYGDGPERTALIARAAKLAIEDRTTFAGVFNQSERDSILCGVDLLVQASQFEGFGVALAEGMAHGVPVVATAVGGVPEVIDDGTTGLLVVPGNPEALATAILTIVSDPSMYARMSVASIERYRSSFTPQHVVPRYVELYRRLTSHE